MKVLPISGNETVMDAAAIAAKLVALEETRTRSRMLAYASIANQIGRSVDWLRGLLRGSVHRIDSEVRDRLHTLLIKGWESEIRRLEAELAVARQTACRPDSDEIREVETLLRKARAILTPQSIG